ncbi:MULTISPECIES: LysM peptidoglycan-binding domain-containing protein [unclassified Massilia]|uniref:LysM peptidoglycan-binding domain-containing protein n=1 Tax=unclassified Massilia TaxID=2609279 RepID=UPI0017858BE9|nr:MULTISPECIES: LysM peptidoglycan-binding domain-containing protein [unclassified Massilia]MBD8530630.1 LysM peptidoglycan-binding domain-containing protein [Massilia sp. CFBP 13647]MBD8674855.1 LysM peptidoglycan-binding domain-containing protein [Massilia sp. CFBP 13721]
MKNFSTVAARAAAAALVACVVAGPVQAAECSFKPNAPDQHRVVKGDTLWDISGAFLEHPWCWPQVWGMNREEIRNPHWIYPGQIVYFDRARGRLSLTKPGSGGDGDAPVLRLSPQVRSEGLERGAIDAIPAGVIEPYLTQPLVVEKDALAGAPRIAASEENRLYLGTGDRIYVRGNLAGATEFQVFRPGGALKDPQTGAVLAHEATYVGTVKLVKAAAPGVDVHTMIVASSVSEMGVGDRLIPAPPPAVRNYVPHAPAADIDARVMSIYAGVTYAGQSQVVTVNRGSIDGLDVGAVLQLYHFGKTVADPEGSKGVFGLGRPTMKLPDEQYGSLFIFRVFGRVSYGLIMQVTAPVEVGDVAKSPE